VADQFKQPPTEVARDLDDDPERMAMQCVMLLRYAEAKRVFENASAKDLQKLKGSSKMMQLVEDITFALAEEEILGGS